MNTVQPSDGIAKSIISTTSRSPIHSGRYQRYRIDIRTRVLVGPEDYFDIDPVYRLSIWPADVRDAVSRPNLTPSPRLVGIR